MEIVADFSSGTNLFPSEHPYKGFKGRPRRRDFQREAGLSVRITKIDETMWSNVDQRK
jgi:hypothetical protein